MNSSKFLGGKDGLRYGVFIGVEQVVFNFQN